MYSTLSLLTIADCSAVLLMANRDVDTFNYRITSINYRRNNNSLTTQQAQAETLVVQAEIASLETTIAALPEGPAKEDQITKKMRKELQLRSLSNRGSSQGPVALLDQELELARLNQQLAETMGFIGAVTVRRDELTT